MTFTPAVAAEPQILPDSTAFSKAQTFTVSGDVELPKLDRGNYEVVVKPKPKPKPVVRETNSNSNSDSYSVPSAPANVNDAQAYARNLVAQNGWGDDQWNCLYSLWNRESGWRSNAANSSSGAYGIPQALPGSKMASAGADWQTNAATQINWGMSYIKGRYGTPCGAWGHSQSVGWY